MLLGFALLVVGGDFLVRASVALSLKLNISKMVIGLTVVSFATSLPELLVSLNAALNGSPSIAINNVVGSAGGSAVGRGDRVERRHRAAAGGEPPVGSHVGHHAAAPLSSLGVGRSSRVRTQTPRPTSRR